MTQNNGGYQDLIINNGVLSAGTNLVTSDTSGLQGLQMTNQFAICANPGSNPVLVPCIAPMLLSPQTTIKAQIDGNNPENRSQTTNNHLHAMPQIQLSNNFTIPANMAINSAGNLPLGLSYINLSSLTSQTGNAAFPIQLALNTGSNQQITLPLASITQLTNDLQISNAYTLAPQIKFEPEVNANDHLNQLSDNNSLQKTIIKSENQEGTDDSIANKRTRKKGPVRKTQFMKKLRTDESVSDMKSNQTNGDSEVLYDHKGRPFIYECNQCPKKFTQNSRLTAHLRCHSGIRPYTCNQCGFSFTQKSYLIRHAAVHKEDRPFTCAKCLKTYKHYGSLANHRKLHCRDGLTDSNTNGVTNDGSTGIDDLDETIQRTIDSTQISNQSNLILAYTNSSTQLQSESLIYFSQNPITVNSNNDSQTHTSSLNNLNLPGSGPVVFPSHELTSLTAVSLLPTNQTAINELKSITTNLAIKNPATMVDADEIPETSDGHLNMPNEFHHIKQEPSYITVSLQVNPAAQAEN